MRIAWEYLDPIQKAQLQFLRPDLREPTHKGKWCDKVNRTCTEGDCSLCQKGEKVGN